MQGNIKWAEADTAEPDFVTRALAFPCPSSCVTVLIGPVLCSAAVNIAAKARRWARKALQVVVLEMGLHVPEAHDLVAKMALSCPPTVGQLVRGQARKEELGARRFVRVAFLGNLKMTEAAKN
jgi:hypothetical protein